MSFNNHTAMVTSLLSLMCSAIIGCESAADGPPRAAVNGIVSLDGEPLEAGVIRFIPQTDIPGPKVSVAITNGFFQLTELDGPVVGQHRIEIEGPAAGSLAFDDEEALKQLEQSRLKSGRKTQLEVVRIPLVYNQKSRLEATIVKGDPNDLTFDLLSQPK